MSWLYYVIREQYNLFRLDTFWIFQSCASLSGVINSLAHRTFDTKYMFVVSHKPTQRTSTVTHSEWDSHNWPIQNQAMSEKWVRILPHLQQLHIYVIYWVENCPISLSFAQNKVGRSDFSQWLTQWLNWRNDKMLYQGVLTPWLYLLALLLKSTANHGTVMGRHVLYKCPVSLQRNASSSYTIHTCPCTKLCSNWLRAGKDMVWTVIGYWIKLISVQEKIFWMPKKPRYHHRTYHCGNQYCKAHGLDMAWDHKLLDTWLIC